MQKYVPGIRFHFLTPFYDRLIKITMPEKLFKKALIEQVNIGDSQIVLDFGCGTGTLAIMAKTKNPKATVLGLDIDNKMVEKAKKKIADQKVDIKIDKYDGNILPYADNSFDKIITSLVIHHLTSSQKEHVFREFRRILKIGGEVHIADFAKPDNTILKIISSILRHFEPIDDNIHGLLPKYLQEAKFSNVRERKNINTIFGTIYLYQAIKG